jgi:hypothetical protein
MEVQYKTETFTYPNAIVRVHFPDITEEENSRRMKKIRKTAEELLKDKIQRKEKKM